MIKPLSTSLISTETVRDADVDTFARHVYPQIEDPDARAAIEARLAAFYGEPVSLDTVYDVESPLRAAPHPPRIELTASAAPLPDDPSLADLRRWQLTWNVIGDPTDADTIGTELTVDEPSYDYPRAEASAFERALFAFDGTTEAAWSIANNAIVPHPPVVYEALTGPASGSETFDILDHPRMGLRATVVRNGTFPPECHYFVTNTAAPVVPTIDRTDREFALENVLRRPDASMVELLDAVGSLQPERVAIYFMEAGPLPILLPVLLVIDSWDAHEVANVLEQWRVAQEKEEGRYVLDLNTRGLRLRLSLNAR